MLFYNQTTFSSNFWLTARFGGSLSKDNNMTWEIHKKEFDNIIKMSGSDRYDYFVRKVADWEEIWGLKSPSGWCLFGSSDENQTLPIWPHPRFAELHVSGSFSDSKPELIELDSFISKWLPGMTKDGLLVAVFPGTEMKSVVIEPTKLLEDLIQETEQYE